MLELKRGLENKLRLAYHWFYMNEVELVRGSRIICWYCVLLFVAMCILEDKFAILVDRVQHHRML